MCGVVPGEDRAQLGLSETNPRINSGTQYFNPRTAKRMDGAVQLEIRRIVVSTGIQRESSTPSSSLIRSIECKWHRNSPFNCRQLAVATPFLVILEDYTPVEPPLADNAELNVLAYSAFKCHSNRLKGLVRV